MCDRKFLNKALVLLFWTVLCLPLLDICFGLDTSRGLKEKRILSKLPPLPRSIKELQKFPQSFDGFFKDNFGFRKSMIRANFLLKYNVLRKSPVEKVVVGRDGWLYYNGEGAIDDSRGITQYDAQTLERWARTLEMKRAWLAAQGIQYLFVLVPNKGSVYGEYFPASYTIVNQESGIELLARYLKAHTNVPVIEMLPVLRAAKGQERLYHKTDSHWNEYGAYLAYREIMSEVRTRFPHVHVKSLQEFAVEKKKGPGADLATMMGGNAVLTEEYIRLKPKHGSGLTVTGLNDSSKSPVIVDNGSIPNPRALVFRDSFFTAVAPFMLDQFQYARYYWQYWNVDTPIEDILKTVKPNIVIEEIVERLVKTGMADFVSNPPNIFALNNGSVYNR